MKKILSVVMVACFALTVPALAAIEEGNGELGFNYGNTNYDNGNSNADVESSNDLSLRGGYFMTRMFELEGQFINTDTDVAVSGVNVGNAEMDVLMVNGVFNFHPRENLTPYFLVGLGRADVEFTGAPGDDSMAYQFGGGTRWFFGKAQRAAVRFDLAFVNEDTGNVDKTHTSVAAGFSWRLGN